MQITQISDYPNRKKTIVKRLRVLQNSSSALTLLFNRLYSFQPVIKSKSQKSTTFRLCHFQKFKSNAKT